VCHFCRYESYDVQRFYVGPSKSNTKRVVVDLPTPYFLVCCLAPKPEEQTHTCLLWSPYHAIKRGYSFFEMRHSTGDVIVRDTSRWRMRHSVRCVTPTLRW
jgi:hypothetical protein